MLKIKPNSKNASSDPVLTTQKEKDALLKMLEQAEALAENNQTRTQEFSDLNKQLHRKTGYYLDGVSLSKKDVLDSIQSIADIELGSREPVTHIIPLTWNTFDIATAMQKTMKENGFKTREGKEFTDILTFGMEKDKTAFVIVGFKSKSALQIYIENEAEQIRFMGGIEEKYLPKGKKLAQYKKTFNKSDLLGASRYFEELMKVIGITNEEVIAK